MMLPILISVSVAPVSYFFWAAALPLATAIAAIAIGIARLSFLEDILLPLDFLTLVVDGLKIVRHLPCTVRHQEDDEEQKDAEHRAGEALRNSLRYVRHEDDKGRTQRCTRDEGHQFQIRNTPDNFTPPTRR